MACDLIVAAEDAQLGEPEIRFGSAPVTLLMPFLIGQKKTRELLLTGDLDRRGRGGADRPRQPRRARRTGSPPRSTPWPTASPASRPGRHGADEADAQPGDGRRRASRRRSRWASTSSRSSTCRESSREFDAIVRRDGLKAALAWRDARYDERLADAGAAPSRESDGARRLGPPLRT